MGDHVLATCRCGADTIAVKADKTFTREIGTPVGIDFDSRSIHLFGGEHGARIRGL